MQIYRITLLGKLQVQGSETTIARFRTRKTALLLAYLAYYPSRPVSRDTLIELLWPELDCDAARNNLSTALSSLRRQLEPPGITPGAILFADRHSVQLRTDAIVTDAAEFEQALRIAHAATEAEKVSLLNAALKAYGGSLLPDYDADWIRAERLRLEIAYQEARRGWEALETSQDVAPDTEQSIKHSRRANKHAALLLPSVPPLGTVTFLAVGWAQEANVASPAQASAAAFSGVAQAIARRECGRWGGYEVESDADTFVALFASASEAMGCALACHRTLETQPFAGKSGDLAARMALRVGEVETEEDIACHPDCLLTLRLLDAAHGGQTLGAAPLESLADRGPRSNIRWKDLGEYRLAEGQRPERIFQIEAASQSSYRFPPLRAARLHTETLPLPLNRFFGREAELARLTELLLKPHTRLVTLTGMGGAGKTRLAIEVGHRVQAAISGLVWFVPLASLESASQIPDALCRTLNLPRKSHSNAFAQICEFLNRQESRSLLILDNFEPFVVEGAEWLQELLTRVPNVACLLTSRQSLELPGEQEWPVRPLPLPVEGCWLRVEGKNTFISHEVTNNTPPSLPQPSTLNPQLLASPSVQLFVNRAQAVKPDFQLTPGNADCIARICIALEGIPLAIELATARAQVMTPSEMLDALQQRFDFLTTQRRSILPRHRALRATLDWSYERLRPEWQLFFAHLSVFRDGWTVQAAVEVCGTKEAREWLQELRARSFILESEKPGIREMRFYALETLREYGAEKLEPEDETETRKRHAICFLQLAETAAEHLHGLEQAQWLECLEAEYANLRAALTWSLSTPEEAETALRLAGALWSFFQIRGYIREGREYLQAALAHSSGHPTRPRAQALNGAGALAQIQGDYAEAGAAYAQSLKIWQILGNEQGVASALNNLGLVAELQGDYVEAQELYEKGLALREKLNDRHGLAASYNNLGILMQMRRDYTSARGWYARSLDLKRELQQGQGVAATLNNLGNVAHALHDYEASRAYHEESLEIRQRLGEKQGIAGSLNNLGMVAESLGQYQEARNLYERSLAIKQELGDRQGAGMTLHNMANLARLQGDLTGASATGRQSLQVQQAIGDKHAMTGSLHALAAIAHAQGDAKRAVRLYAAHAALCEAMSLALSETEQAEQGAITSELRDRLGAKAFAREQAVGTALTLEQAVAYALSAE